MDKATVFTKTAKGITQVNQKSGSLSKDLMKVLKLIDGKSNFGQLVDKAEMDRLALEKALNTLTKDGFARVFQTRKEEVDPFGDDDFDFTAPGKMPASTQRVVPGAANDISELVKQQERADADKRAKAQAHEAAKAKAKSEAEARAKLEAEARARQLAEQQAMEQARRAKEAAERARAELDAKMREEEARQRAVAEQQARQAAEHKAREEEEQRKLTELRAKAEREANERARAELEARLKEEEAKKKAAAEQQARHVAEAKAREEQEQRRLAEIRVKAEREAQALAEARARAEAEAAAMARARAEADAAAQRKAQEATQAEAQMKARLKEEIESRIRSEMEELLRNQIEEKTRDEIKAQILAEARLAAKAELEDRLREERETIARAENEARARAEEDAQRRAEVESKKRAEAEARAAAETEARIRAEEEARTLRAQAEEQARRAKELEARARAEAESRAREQAEVAAKMEAERQAAERQKAEAARRLDAERQARAKAEAEANTRLEAERQAKYEAEARAKLEAEERAKRERELAATIETERKAKEEAEMRARIEARARETIEVDTRAKVQAEIEGDMTKRAEIEGKAQAKAYMEAKVRAEQEEEERIREEQARKAREIADVLRTKVEPDEVAPESAPARRRRAARRGSLAKPMFFGLLGSVVLAVALLHVVPLRPYTAKVERTLGAWLGEEVIIGSMVFRLVPSPHLRIENLAVGKLLDAKAANGRLFLDITTLFGERPTLNEIELENLTVSNEAARRIPQWGRAQGKEATGGISLVKLRNVKMDLKPVPETFDATLSFAADGNLRQAMLSSGGATATFKPREGGAYDVDAVARNWTLPLGAPIPVSEARLKGTWSGAELVVPEFEADAMEGKVAGTLKVGWASGVRLESDLSLTRVDAKALVGAFTNAISVTGRLDGNFTFAAEGPTAAQLFSATRSQGKFKLVEGSVSNVDLVAVMQSDTAGQRAGVTKFAELTGEFSAADGRAAYRNLALQGGVLRGNGGVEVGGNGNLAGRLALEIRSQVAQDRGAFVVSGTVQRPSIRRGG